MSLCKDDHFIGRKQEQGHQANPELPDHESDLAHPRDGQNPQTLSNEYHKYSTEESDSTYGSHGTPVEDPKHFNDDATESCHESQENEESYTTNDKPVSWRSLPRKDQLFVLTLARLAEPLVQTSLSSYVFFMLKSFNPSLSDSTISSQAGWLTGSFTAAQAITAVLWGKLADKEVIGRKNVLIIGLLGTFVSTIGFGFSRSLLMAVFCRSLGGVLNGNVSVMRTLLRTTFILGNSQFVTTEYLKRADDSSQMISEIIVEKKFQPKAFLMMPVTFNVGVLIGPLLGGWLQDPVHTFPNTFGPGSRLGGSEGVSWMLRFPYALPNLVTGTFLFLSIFLVVFSLEETHADRKHRPDYGLTMGRAIARFFQKLVFRRPNHRYSKVGPYEPNAIEMNIDPTEDATGVHCSLKKHTRSKLPYRQIFTSNVCKTLLAHGMLAAHLGAFANMWFLFLSTPRFDSVRPNPPQHTGQHLPLSFTGGLGLPPPTIGLAIGVLGALGLSVQFGVYSTITHKLGLMSTYRYALLLFPFAYSLSPFLAIFPTSHGPPHPADGPWIWVGIVASLFVQVVGRSFSLPISQILINNCTPHPSVLSSVHGIGQSVSAGCRTIGPVLWSYLYGLGLKKGVVGLGWWTLAGEAILVVLASMLLYEGSGHEIKLDGDQEDGLSK